jgi:hypothetical protein
LHRTIFSFAVSLLILIQAIAITDAAAIGVYLNLPSFFTIADSLRTQVAISQSYVQPDEGTVSFLAGEIGFKARRRSFVRMGISYAAMHREASVIHGIGDGFFYMTFRAAGDTLDTGGLFIRFDARFPFGSEAFSPFSFKSLDGGAGLEWRHRLQLFGLRLAATYNLVGERRKSDSAFINRNFLLIAAQMYFASTRTAQLYLSGYAMQYRGGGSREAYVVTLDQALSDNFSVRLFGGLEAGEESDRTFNSLLSATIVYRFPVRKEPNGGPGPQAPPETVEPDGGK